MKTKLLTLIFAMLLGYGALGQGATSIQQAWNKTNSTPGVAPAPNEFWFILETDINADGDDWKTETGLTGPPSNPRAIGFNDSTTTGSIAAGTTDGSGGTPDYTIKTIDHFSSNGCSGSPPDYEEWYIIKVPSTGIIYITITLTGPTPLDTFLFTNKTLQWYEFNAGQSFDVAACGGSEGVMYQTLATGSSDTISFLGGIKPTLDYVALRIGNNYFAGFPPFSPAVTTFTAYTLSIYTTNNTCDKALQAPVQDGTSNNPFTSSTNKGLLTTDFPDITGTPAPVNDFYGADEYSTSTGGINGIWFRASESVFTSLYAAACGSTINPQLLIFSQCPDGSEDEFIAGEDQNIENDTASISFNDLWNRDVCTPVNNEDWPVIRFPRDSSEYFFFLFGASDGDFDFYLLNDGGDILPVDWIDFSGQSMGNTNRLNWSTATETQNDFFNLEKSADGINYETLAQIPGQGDAIFQNDYSTLDESPYYQTYYRISQVDYDGTVNTGPQTVVINDSKKVYINLLANPVTNNEIKLRYRSDREQEVVFFLTGLDGKRVKSQSVHFIEGSSDLNLAIPGVAPGLYLLSASVNGEQWTEKVVVR